MVDNIRIASNGRLNVTLYPNTAIVGSMEGFQACGEGVFEMHESWSGYAAGVDPVFRCLSAFPMGEDPYARLVWIYEAGGKEFMEKAFREKLNLHLLAVEAWPSEAAHGNVKATTLDDFKGLKFRTGDPRWGKQVGIDSISLPLEDTFTALQTGAVDVAEFGSLAYNEGIGLTDITKYVYWPDWWNVFTIASVVVNLDAWSGLPPDLQKILEMCARANEVSYFTRYQWLSAQLFQKMKEEGKTEFIRLPAQDMVKLRAAMDQVELEERDKSPLISEYYDLYEAFKKTYYPYREMTKWWGEGLSVEDQLGRLARD